MSVREAFKAYDVRGRVPDELNEQMASAVGAGFAELFHPRQVIMGRDVRPSGGPLSEALAQGLRASGVEVLDLGLCGTEEVYFATAHLGTGGGIMITASHNPPDYNGMKFVAEGASAVSADTGLEALARWVEAHPLAGEGSTRAPLRAVNTRPEYVLHLLGLIDTGAIKPLRVVVNAGDGCAGPTFDALAATLPLDVVRLAHEPDGRFPNGVPNPLLRENRAATARAVRKTGAALGIAWDGDFDRCFFFDERGEFVEAYYLVGLLAEAFLRKHPGEKIIHDPRLVWNTLDIVHRLGGIPIESKCGHAFIKDRMRRENAIYGGEMSAHHYFRDFFYCDSGMIPWLLLLELMSVTGARLSELVAARQRLFPVSGEINRKVRDSGAAMRRVEAHFADKAVAVSHPDGLSMEFDTWRFNLRPSNTEPLLRLNVESHGDAEIVSRQVHDILRLLDQT